MKKWIEQIRESERQERINFLLENSVLYQNDPISGIVGLTQDICSRNHIEYCPELRKINMPSTENENTSLNKASMAIMRYINSMTFVVSGTNTIVVNEQLLKFPKEVVQGVVAHELSHIVFGDNPHKKEAENRADRFPIS